MKCKQSFIKLSVILLIAVAALNLSLMKMDEDYSQHAIYERSYAQSENYAPVPPSTKAINFIETTQTTSSPMAYLFQLLFILFLISPPLIVIYLCLIWKELKKRNELK